MDGRPIGLAKGANMQFIGRQKCSQHPQQSVGVFRFNDTTHN